MIAENRDHIVYSNTKDYFNEVVMVKNPCGYTHLDEGETVVDELTAASNSIENAEELGWHPLYFPAALYTSSLE